MLSFAFWRGLIWRCSALQFCRLPWVRRGSGVRQAVRDGIFGREISSMGCAFAARAVSFSDGGGLLLMGDSRISAGASGRRGAVSCLGRHFA